MYCQSCGCELPSIAKFCVKCGSIVGVPASRHAVGSFCVNCGRPYDTTHRFCNFCGHGLPRPENRGSAEPQGVDLTSQTSVYCNYCGFSNPKDALFCSACGRALGARSISEPILKTAPVAEPTFQAGQTFPSAPQTSGFAVYYSQISDGDLLRIWAEKHTLLPSAAADLEHELVSRGLDLNERKEPSTPPTLATTAIPVEDPETKSTLSPTIIDEGSEPAISTDLAPGQLFVQPPNAAPYANLTIQSASAVFLLSASIFTLIESPGPSAAAVMVAVISILLATVVSGVARKQWNKVLAIEPHTNTKFRSRHRKFVVTGIVFILLSIGLAGLLGFVIGQNRRESVQLESDRQHQLDLAERITKARTRAAATISSYVGMYAAIVPDVQDYSATLRRLSSDIEIYDEKFPNQHADTMKFKASVDKEIQRAALLRQQIDVAKAIESLDEFQQKAAWQRDMVPLLQQEDRLDHSS